MGCKPGRQILKTEAVPPLNMRGPSDASPARKRRHSLALEKSHNLQLTRKYMCALVTQLLTCYDNPIGWDNEGDMY